MIFLLLVVATHLLLPATDGACTPDQVKDNINSCLTQNSLNTYFQFPILLSTKYTNLCYNTTCMTLCMESAIEACQSESHTVYLGGGEALKAAYLGYCHQTETNVTNAMTCGSTVNNQDALNIVSLFHNNVQSYYDTNSVDTTVICADWLTMNTGLTALVTAACSGEALTMWQSFMNTIHAECDSTRTPSYYDDYRHTPVEQCTSAAEKTIPCCCFVLLFLLLNTFVQVILH